MKYYTGVGSRKAPIEVIKLTMQLAVFMSFSGYGLRSGKADGMDSAFQFGAERSLVKQKNEIYVPWRNFNNNASSTEVTTLDDLDNNVEAEKIAIEFHPCWERCSKGVKRLHTRNVYQVLGKTLNDPSDLLICWAEPTRCGVKGGTNTAVQIAKHYGVEVYNLWDSDAVNKIIEFVKAK